MLRFNISGPPEQEVRVLIKEQELTAWSEIIADAAVKGVDSVDVKLRRLCACVLACEGALWRDGSLTSLSNWESGASPQSSPPPEDSELSDGEVMVWRLEL